MQALQVNTLNVTNSDRGAVRLTQVDAVDRERITAATVDGNLDITGIAQTDATESGNVVVNVSNGNLTVSGAINVAGTGDIDATVNGNLIVDAGIAGNADINVTVSGSTDVNAVISTSTASTIEARLTGDLQVDANITANGGEIEFVLGNDMTMNTAASIVSVAAGGSGNGAIDVQAGGTLNLSTLTADSLINLDVEGAVLNEYTDATANLNTDLAVVSAKTGVGHVDRVLNTAVDRLAVENLGNGNIMIADADDLNLVSELSGGFAVWTSGVSLGLGQVDIRTLTGDLGVQGRVQTDAGFVNGSVALTAQAGDITLANKVKTTIGNVALKAQGDITFTQSGGVEARGGNRTIDVWALQGSVVMDQVSKIDSNDREETNHGNVRIEAAQNVVVGRITGGEGQVTIVTDAMVLDADTDDTLDNTRVNVKADNFRVEAHSDVGALANRFETDTAVIAGVSTTGSIYLNEVADTSIGNLGGGVVMRGEFGDWTQVSQNADLSGLAVGANQDLLVNAAGDLTIDAHVIAGSNSDYRITSGDDLTVTERGDIIGGAGTDLTLIATADAVIDGNIVLGSASDLHLSAASITMGAQGSLGARSGDMAMTATAGDVVLGQVSTVGGVMISGQNVTSAIDNNDTINVRASQISVDANQLGTVDNAIVTHTGQLTVDVDADAAVNANGDAHVINLGNLNVVSQAAFVVNELAYDASVTGNVVTPVAQFDADGSVSIETRDGNLSIDQIRAGGDMTLTVGDRLQVQSGHLISAENLELSTGSDRDLSITTDVTRIAGSIGGALTLTETDDLVMASLETAGHSVINVSGDLTLTGQSAIAGDLNLDVTGAIDAAGTQRLAANELTIDATAVGSADQSVGLDVDRLTVDTATRGDGGVYLDQMGDLRLEGITSDSHVVMDQMGDLMVMGAVSGAGNVQLVSTGLQNIDANLSAGADLTLDAGRGMDVHRSVTLSAGNDLGLAVGEGNLVVHGQLSIDQSANLNADGFIRLANDLSAGDAIAIESGSYLIAQTINAGAPCR